MFVNLLRASSTCVPSSWKCLVISLRVRCGSCLTLCDPLIVACQAPLAMGVLDWIAMPSSRGSAQPRDRTCFSISPALAGRFLSTSVMISSLMLFISLHSLHSENIFFPTFLPLPLSFLYSVNSHRSPILGLPCTHGADATAAVHDQGPVSPGDMWQCLETFLVVTKREGAAPGIWDAVNTLQDTGQRQSPPAPHI